jgi:hypothetical protein
VDQNVAPNRLRSLRCLRPHDPGTCTREDEGDAGRGFRQVGASRKVGMSIVLADYAAIKRRRSWKRAHQHELIAAVQTSTSPSARDPLQRK